MSKREKVVFALVAVLSVGWTIYFALAEKTASPEIQEIHQQLEKQALEMEAFELRVKDLPDSSFTALTLQKELLDLRRYFDADRRQMESELEALEVYRLYNWSYIFPILLGLLAFFSINKFIERVAVEKVEEIVGDNLLNIKRVFESETWSVNLRGKNEIHVITKDKVSSGVRSVLDIEDRKHMKQFDWSYKSLSDDPFTAQNVTSLLGEKANILFIDMDGFHSGPMSDEQIENLEGELCQLGESICGKQGKGIFYFTTNQRPRFPRLESNNFLTAFANTESQIYPNLMNLLKLYDKLGKR